MTRDWVFGHFRDKYLRILYLKIKPMANIYIFQLGLQSTRCWQQIGPPIHQVLEANWASNPPGAGGKLGLQSTRCWRPIVPPIQLVLEANFWQNFGANLLTSGGQKLILSLVYWASVEGTTSSRYFCNNIITHPANWASGPGHSLKRPPD